MRPCPRFLFPLVAFLATAGLLPATTVTGQISSLIQRQATSQMTVLFTLQNCPGTPTVAGNAVSRQASTPVLYNGTISATLAPNDTISCAGTAGLTYYQLVVMQGSVQLASKNILVTGSTLNVVSVATLDLSTLSAYPAPPNPTTPTVAAGNENVSFSATPTFSASTRSSRIQLTGNLTTFTLAAGSDGQEKTLAFCQDATGGRTVTAPANVRGFFTVGTTASKCNSQHFTYFSSLSAWLADGIGVVNQ